MPSIGCSLCDASLWLLLAIAASWVGVAQLARAAEKLNGSLQPTSIVHLMTWANATAWMVLALPHAIRKSRESKSDGFGGRSTWTSLKRLFSADVFQCRHAFQFLAIALGTNYAYIAALHYLAASLNTAIFCTSPVFTLLFSIVWLNPHDSGSPSLTGCICEPLFTWQGLAVMLSVLGVIFIAEPWHGSTAHLSLASRLSGTALSIVAALGTATYQVYFKRTFGDRMLWDEVGLFLAYMGFLIFVVVGAFLMIAYHSGSYPLVLNLVPWGLVVSTSICSALFNFLIKYGLSRDTPVSVSLATQIGIPLNLMVDCFVVGAHIDAFQACGTLIMLVAFSVQQGTCTKAVSNEEDARNVTEGSGVAGFCACPCAGSRAK